MTPVNPSHMKQQLKEGMYWEALGLPPSSSHKDFTIKIAEFQHQSRNDQEAMILLSETKQDLESDRYTSSKELCDDLFKRLGKSFSAADLCRYNVTRERIWRDVFRPKLSSNGNIKACLAKALRSYAIDIASEQQADGLDINATDDALDSVIRLLEVAKVYADDPKENQELLRRLKDKRASLYCNRGVELINRAQENLKDRMENVQSRASNDDPVYAQRSIEEAFDAAINAVQEGVAYIERGLQVDYLNKTIQEQLATGKEMLKSLQQQRGQVAELIGRQSASFYCNRGVERINRAQQELQSELNKIHSKIDSGEINVQSLLVEAFGLGTKWGTPIMDRDELMRMLSRASADGWKLPMSVIAPAAFSRAVSEMKAGLSDIENAMRLDPHNAHVKSQLEQGKKILEGIGGHYEPSASKAYSSPSSSQSSNSRKQASGASSSRSSSRYSTSHKKEGNIIGHALGQCGRFFIAFFDSLSKVGR